MSRHDCSDRKLLVFRGVCSLVALESVPLQTTALPWSEQVKHPIIVALVLNPIEVRIALVDVPLPLFPEWMRL